MGREFLAVPGEMTRPKDAEALISQFRRTLINRHRSSERIAGLGIVTRGFVLAHQSFADGSGILSPLSTQSGLPRCIAQAVSG